LPNKAVAPAAYLKCQAMCEPKTNYILEFYPGSSR